MSVELDYQRLLNACTDVDWDDVLAAISISWSLADDEFSYYAVRQLVRLLEGPDL